jgi:hypothetical protein
MRIKVEVMGKIRCVNEMTLRVTVPAEEVDAAIAEAYQYLRDKVKIDGFRSGHAPDQIIEQRYRELLMNLQKEYIYTRSWMQVQDQEGMKVIRAGDVQLISRQIERGKPVSYMRLVHIDGGEFDLKNHESPTVHVTGKPNDTETGSEGFTPRLVEDNTSIVHSPCGEED